MRPHAPRTTPHGAAGSTATQSPSCRGRQKYASHGLVAHGAVDASSCAASHSAASAAARVEVSRHVASRAAVPPPQPRGLSQAQSL
jgi:hypothetical protein